MRIRRIRKRIVPAGKEKKKATDPARVRELEDVKTEFGRLMMAVDDVKKYGSVTQLALVGQILRCAYLTIDSHRENQ